MDKQQWMEQSLPITEIKRGGATIWLAGANGLIGDSLGPIMHSHDGASEIFYFVSGRCRLEIGDSEEIFVAGDFVLVPPEVPHNLWNASDEDLLVFWLVAPNFINHKWRTDHFAPGALSRRAIRGHVHSGADLPNDQHIGSRLMTLSPGQSHSGKTAPNEEAVLYVVEGEAQVKVGKLGGRLKVNDFVPILPNTVYAVNAPDEATSFILFEMPGLSEAF